MQQLEENKKNMTQKELIESIRKAADVIQAQRELIQVLYGQVVDLSLMSKIELGDDVIAEIKRLTTKIKENE